MEKEQDILIKMSEENLSIYKELENAKEALTNGEREMQKNCKIFYKIIRELKNLLSNKEFISSIVE